MSVALAKLLTLKVAAVAVVATATVGGAALAATGVLPTPFGTGGPGSNHPTGKPGDSDGHSPASPSPSLVGLCRAFTAGATDNKGHAIDNPAFGALVSAAGGVDKVAGFCETLLATQGADTPSGHPTGRPTVTGPPANVPDHASTGHPTGPPSPPPSH